MAELAPLPPLPAGYPRADAIAAALDEAAAWGAPLGEVALAESAPDDDDQGAEASPVPAAPAGALGRPRQRSRGRHSRSSGRGAAGGFRVNTAACTGKTSKDLYAAVAAALGWREVDIEARSAGALKASVAQTIYCIMQTAELAERLPLPATSWATRYLGLPDLCDKGNMARMVWLCQDFFAEDTFAFNPPTWVLPEQYDELRGAMRTCAAKTYIVKPQDGSQGDGIFLAQSLRDLNLKLSVKANKAGVVQRYIERPLLLRGYKFDFRVYVAFIGGSRTQPPGVFLCREGLARFCTEPYEEPSQKNMHKCMAHLTNYSLNKRSDRFEHGGETIESVFSDAAAASKRPLTVALRQIAAEDPGFDPEEFYEDLASLVGTTAALMAPVLQHAGRNAAAGGELRSCQLLGFDVMLDHDRRPFLLEVNNAPSLCIEEALPLGAEEAALLAERGVTGRASLRTASGDTICRCMDMAQLHYHQTSLVDLEVKRTAMAGLFQLLEQVQTESQAAPAHPDYIPVLVECHEVYDLLARVEVLFSRAGGASKAFTSAGLRRALGPLCGGDGASLQKHDLDALAQRVRVSRFSKEPLEKVDALRLFDFLDVLRQVSARAFPGTPAAEALAASLARLDV